MTINAKETFLKASEKMIKIYKKDPTLDAALGCMMCIETLLDDLHQNNEIDHNEMYSCIMDFEKQLLDCKEDERL